MKTLEIEIPKGHEIDKEKSTFERIVFKEKDKRPTTIEELNIGVTSLFFTYGDGEPWEHFRKYTKETHDAWPSYKEAEAAVALAQLLWFRNAWGGKANGMFAVYYQNGEFGRNMRMLSFNDYQTCRLFEKTFADLIKKVEPLL